MGQQKLRSSNTKEYLIIAFVLVSTLLVMTDVTRNLSDEIHIASEIKTLSPIQKKPLQNIKSTLSEEELKRWTERLIKQSE